MQFLKWVVLCIFIIGILFTHFYLPRIITQIKNPLVQLIRQHQASKLTFQETSENGKFISFTSFDNIELSAFLTYSKLDTAKGTVLLLHGIRAYKEHFIPLSNRLANRGYHAVALDSRAHGESKGNHCTFGVKEKKDLSILVTLLLEQEQLSNNIGVWGQSLGGAIGLQAMGVDKRIKFGIIESTFTDFKTIANDYVNYYFGFNINLLTNYLVDRAGTIATFDPSDARPVDYCKKITQPILVVHGAKDARINIAYGKTNFEQLSSDRKDFIEIKEANHVSVWEEGGKEYFDRVFRFLAETQ